MRGLKVFSTLILLLFHVLHPRKWCLALEKLELVRRKSRIFELGQISDPRKCRLRVLLPLISILHLRTLIIRNVGYILRGGKFLPFRSFVIALKTKVSFYFILRDLGCILNFWYHIDGWLGKTRQTMLNNTSLAKVRFSQGRLCLVNLQWSTVNTLLPWATLL